MPLVLGVSFCGEHVSEDFTNDGASHVVESHLDSTIAAAYKELSRHYASRSTLD
jgi:hypothetical protein